VGNDRSREATGFIFSQEDGDRLWCWLDLSFVFISCWGFITWEIESGIGVIRAGFITVESMSDRVDGVGEVSSGDALSLKPIFLKTLEGFKDGF
jgi:hypothetical protein